jgi:hypothetical protein
MQQKRLKKQPFFPIAKIVKTLDIIDISAQFLSISIVNNSSTF